MKRLGKRIFLLLCGGVLIGVLMGIAVLAYFHLFPEALMVTRYTISGDVNQAIRIVHLSDLHNAEFGEGNMELIETIKAQEPDLIVITGDMINRNDENLDIVCSLIKTISGMAPVYYGYGNHETVWEERYGGTLYQALTNAGAAVLDRDYCDIEISGTSIRVGGYMGYYRYPGMTTSDPAVWASEEAFFDEYETTDAYKILLNHIPTAWMDWGNQDKFSVDLVFSGHYHGGLMRIPFLDSGIYAPYVGLFPKYTQGCFVGETATCVLSAGLGNEYTLLPRINNPPEIVVLDLIPEENQ